MTYDLELSFSKTIHARNADQPIPPAEANQHVQGFAEFTLIQKITRTAIGAPSIDSSLRFTRVFTEKLGDKEIVSMEVSGTLGSANVAGTIEGTTDFTIWTPTGITILKAQLDAGGGAVLVQDPTLLTGTPPRYKYYRIVTQ